MLSSSNIVAAYSHELFSTSSTAAFGSPSPKQEILPPSLLDCTVLSINNILPTRGAWNHTIMHPSALNSNPS